MTFCQKKQFASAAKNHQKYADFFQDYKERLFNFYVF